MALSDQAPVSGRSGDEAEFERLRIQLDRVLSENEHLMESLSQLEQSRDFYEALYDGAPIAWLMLSTEGAIEALNARAIALLGHDRRQLLGVPFKSVTAPDDRRRVLEYLSACARGEQLPPCEVRLNGRELPLHVRLESRPPSEPGGRHALALFDLSDRDRAEEERTRLLESQRAAREANAAKDEFIAVLSHELRTPLTPVLAAVSALSERHDLTPELAASVKMIARNVSAEAHLIDDLLDVSRIARRKLHIERRPTDLHRAVEETLDMLREQGSRHEIVVELGAEQTWVNGDALRLRQVFWNLLRNAFKFTPNGGRIKLHSWNHEDRVLVEVSDNGRGIAAEALARLFEPFEQIKDDDRASNGGLGLGLTIARGIVELHDGTLSATSRGLGLGSRFVVELPSVKHERSEVSALGAAPPLEARKPRILLVEDHLDTAETFAELLRKHGYEVRLAASIAEALALEFGDNDIVMSDLGLPDGTGIDLIRRLHERTRVPAIAVSGFGTEADKKACREAGFAMHLTKPVAIEQLLDAIRTLHR